MHSPSIGAVILAGGQSSRMKGKNKATLTLGGLSFLEKIADELSIFDELLISAAGQAEYEGLGYQLVQDTFPGQGPLAGLHAALSNCYSDALFAVSCDAPLINSGLAEYIASYHSSDYDAIVAVTRDGGLHPLCALYSKSVAPLLEKQLREGDNKIRHALNQMRVKTIKLAHSAYPDEMLSNINTPEDYFALQRSINGPPVLAVCGGKDAGKTTLLSGILPLLRDKGISIGLIKHDGHDFVPDVPGTDSYRLREAGASGVAIYSDYRYMLTDEWEGGDFHSMTKFFRDKDLILLEGGKFTDLPKIEVLRDPAATAPVCNRENMLLFCTNTPLRVEGVPTADPNDYTGITDHILRWLSGE